MLRSEKGTVVASKVIFLQSAEASIPAVRI